MTGSRLAGVEHEFVVRRGDEVVDFRLMLPDLDLDGRRLDPGDPNAMRCSWGGVITADGKEAEIAIPPVTISPSATDRVLALTSGGRAALEDALRAHDPALVLDGYSTHLSIEIPDREVRRVARAFTRRAALETIVLIDRLHSPGLLVRPRRRRLELGGEFVDGDDLRAALVFASTAAFVMEAERRPESLPRVRATTERVVERYGWFVPRSGFGPHALPDRQALVREGRRPMTAAERLEQSWRALRPIAARWWSDVELRLVDERIDGRVTLPFERAR